MYYYISYYNLTLYIMFNQNPLLYIFFRFCYNNATSCGFTQKRHTLYVYYIGFDGRFQMFFESSQVKGVRICSDGQASKDQQPDVIDNRRPAEPQGYRTRQSLQSI